MFSDLYCSKIKEHKGTTSFKVILLMCSIWGIYQWLLAFCFSSFRTLYGPSNVFFPLPFPWTERTFERTFISVLRRGKGAGCDHHIPEFYNKLKMSLKIHKTTWQLPLLSISNILQKKANVSTWVPAGLTVRDTNTCASWWHHTPKTKLAVSVDAFNSFLVLLPRTNKKKSSILRCTPHVWTSERRVTKRQPRWEGGGVRSVDFIFISLLF